jgi:hypothetical protein
MLPSAIAYFQAGGEGGRAFQFSMMLDQCAAESAEKTPNNLTKNPSRRLGGDIGLRRIERSWRGRDANGTFRGSCGGQSIKVLSIRQRDARRCAAFGQHGFGGCCSGAWGDDQPRPAIYHFQILRLSLGAACQTLFDDSFSAGPRIQLVSEMLFFG